MRLFIFILPLVVLFNISTATAQGLYREGVHYFAIEPAAKKLTDKKVEVTEVFWYGCGHCYHFEPVLLKWKARQSKELGFVRTPALWSKPMEVHARLFYTAEKLGVLDKMHPRIFKALNEEGKRLIAPEEITPLFGEFGIDGETLDKAIKSEEVTNKVAEANVRQRAYKIHGTPEMIVNGKYRVGTGQTGMTFEQMLEVVDYLVSLEQ